MLTRLQSKYVVYKQITDYSFGDVINTHGSYDTTVFFSNTIIVVAEQYIVNYVYYVLTVFIQNDTAQYREYKYTHSNSLLLHSTTSDSFAGF